MDLSALGLILYDHKMKGTTNITKLFWGVKSDNLLESVVSPDLLRTTKVGYIKTI